MLEEHGTISSAQADGNLDLDVWALVGAALRGCAPSAKGRELDSETLLIEELGLDSLKFVDLTVALEDALGIEEFPMQEWVDEELAAGRSLSVGALVARCLGCLAPRTDEAP